MAKWRLVLEMWLCYNLASNIFYSFIHLEMLINQGVWFQSTDEIFFSSHWGFNTQLIWVKDHNLFLFYAWEMETGDWRLEVRQYDRRRGERVLHSNIVGIHIRQTQLMDHLLFGGVSRVLCWRRRMRRRRGTGPISLGLSHCLLTGQVEGNEEQEHNKSEGWYEEKERKEKSGEQNMV